MPRRRVTAMERSLRALTMATTPDTPAARTRSRVACAAAVTYPLPQWARPSRQPISISPFGPHSGGHGCAPVKPMTSPDLVEHGPQTEAALGVVPALTGGELLVDRQFGGLAAVELHDLGVGEDPVPGEGVLVGGDAQPYVGESSFTGAALQPGDRYR